MSWLSVVRLLVLASLVPLLAVALPLVAEAQARGPSGAAVKAFVTRKEQRLATGVGSSPQSVTVSFGIVRFGQPRAATRRDRLVNGVTGKRIFPARVQYTSHRRWGNGETEAKPIRYRGSSTRSNTASGMRWPSGR